MIRLQTRLGPALGDASRHSRKYSSELCQHAIELALKIGIKHASLETGIPYRRLVRLVSAHRRSTQTFRQAMEEMKPSSVLTRDEDRARSVAKRRAELSVRVEAAREGWKISQRTQTSWRKCVRMAGDRRGLNGKSLTKLVEEGRIPMGWLQ